MSDQAYHEGMLYQYELLRTRLRIREHYLQTAVKDVYDNIGQVLSLIRLQLALLQADIKDDGGGKLEPVRQLTGQVIRDLRKMCRIFYPEEDIIYVEGFVRILKNEILAQWPEGEMIGDKDFSANRLLSNEKMLMTFGILLELVNMIKEERGPLHTAAIICTRQNISFIIDYTGYALPEGKKHHLREKINTTVFEKARLIGGTLKQNNRKDNKIRITLIIPLIENP